MSDQFGRSVAVSGDTVVVGAPIEESAAAGVNGNETDNSIFVAGAAYVFVRDGTTWTQQAYLKASNTGASDVFGHSVAVSGDTVVVGAYGESSAATGVNGNQGRQQRRRLRRRLRLRPRRRHLVATGLPQGIQHRRG
ncbi:MAG: FG-GAP repeat protein [Gammaproteobacteria bacterium]|nr:FG-GAP repeat protein [Gammaproteobacteria bacterium]